MQVTRALSLLSDDNEVAIKALKHCRVQLGARHAAERVLRLWGDDVGLTVDAAKHKVLRLCFPPPPLPPQRHARQFIALQSVPVTEPPCTERAVVTYRWSC